MEYVADVERFMNVAPAASSIFSYMKSDPDLRDISLSFVYGMIDGQSHRAVVKTSCRCCASNCPPAVVWISALTRLDGSWETSHSIDYIAA